MDWSDFMAMVSMGDWENQIYRGERIEIREILKQYRQEMVRVK